MAIERTEQPVTPKRVVLLGASGFLARDLGEALGAAGVEYLAIGSAQVDLTRPESTDQLLELIRPDDALIMSRRLRPKRARTRARSLEMFSWQRTSAPPSRSAPAVTWST